MTRLAILVGNSTYSRLSALPCCLNDVEAVGDLIAATARFDVIRKITNVEADGFKEQLRDVLDANPQIDELFYYFSGHGFQNEADFYYCTANFDPARPNETGLSRGEFHSLLRPSDIPLIVKVIDACHSGNSLIKGGDAYPRIDKGVFKNIIQISSCLDEQFSLTGDPLSEFTSTFCEASVRKPDGSIYYSDIVNAIRDAYLGNESQTPHFIIQSTGREIFSDDSKSLDPFRALLGTKWAAKVEIEANVPAEIPALDEPKTLLAKLSEAQSRVISPDKMKIAINGVFDGVIELVKSEEFSELFDVSVVTHSSYQEDATRGFIIQSLHKTERPDNFVTAEIIRTKKKKRRAAWGATFDIMSSLYGVDDDDYNELWDLKLNCKLERAQLKISLKPKFIHLQRMTLILTAAPSINVCYFFELLLKQKRTDFDEFESEGVEAVRKWWRHEWNEPTDRFVSAIYERLEAAVQQHVEEIEGKI